MELQNNGFIIYIDEEDLDLYNKYKWIPTNTRKGFYLIRSTTINNKKRTIYFHRDICGIIDSNILIDHKNGNGLDNRKENLRTCSILDNNRNAKRRKDNTSGYKGVSWKKDRNKWVSKIFVNGKSIHLGYFDLPEKAYLIYCENAKKYFGDYCNLG